MTEQALFQQFNRNQQRESLDKAKETGLFISLIPSLQEHFYVDSLTTGANQETLSKLLQRSPRIKNETAVIEMIHFLHDEGTVLHSVFSYPFYCQNMLPKNWRKSYGSVFSALNFSYENATTYTILSLVQKLVRLLKSKKKT
jgi:hypothetical protein